MFFDFFLKNIFFIFFNLRDDNTFFDGIFRDVTTEAGSGGARGLITVWNVQRRKRSLTGHPGELHNRY